MTNAGCFLGLSNTGPDKMFVWLEPWADQFEVQAGSTIFLKSSERHFQGAIGEVEWTTDHLIVWANAPMIEVCIDGELQKSGSAIIPIPDGLTKKMLNVLFADQPAARLGGAATNLTEQPSWWQRARRHLGI